MRAVSMELVTPSPIEHCNPVGESFADTLKATLQETDSALPEGDSAVANQGDFEAAIALLGSLTTPLCAASPPPDALGLARLPPVVGEQPSPPDVALPGNGPGDQRVLPIVGEMPPTVPRSVVTPIGNDIIPLPPTGAPAQPLPVGDPRVPVTPSPPPPTIVPTTIGTPVVADAAVPPTDVAQTHGQPLDSAGVIAGNSSTSSAIGHRQPEAITASAAAANSADQSQEAARSGSAPIIDVATHDDRSRPFDLRGDAHAPAGDSGSAAANEAIAMSQSGTINTATNDTVVKVARSLAQLPAVLTDLAQQARTESSPRRVVIPLDPPALGHVTVEIIVRADSVKVSLHHGDEATFNALNAQRPAIEAALESNGLHLSGFDVSGNQRQRPSQTRMAARHFEALVEQVEPDGALRL